MNVINHKVVQTRKEHPCVGCGRKLPKGTKMDSVTSTDSGEIFTDYWCMVCTAYWNKHMRHDDEIGIGELRSEDREGWEEVRKSLEENCAEGSVL